MILALLSFIAILEIFNTVLFFSRTTLSGETMDKINCLYLIFTILSSSNSKISNTCGITAFLILTICFSYRRRHIYARGRCGVRNCFFNFPNRFSKGKAVILLKLQFIDVTSSAR